jgi:MFS transporter, DHA2 family, multidrug resistance protein
MSTRRSQPAGCAADADAAANPGANPGASPWLIAVLVAFAAFMEVLDTTIANVALPYVAGGLGVSEDEASWVVTTYLVANAVSLTGSSYFAQRLGRKAFFLICLALFTASSVLCGFAPNLQWLLVFRIMQGLGGGGMVPVSQSILAGAFPPEKRGQGFALFGILWWWRRWRARRSAAGSPTICRGNGVSSSTARSASSRSG